MAEVTHEETTTTDADITNRNVIKDDKIDATEKNDADHIKTLVTAEDLTSSEPSINYYIIKADTLLESFNQVSNDNVVLKESNKNLTEENNCMKEKLQQAMEVIDMLNEAQKESESSAVVSEDNESNTSDNIIDSTNS